MDSLSPSDVVEARKRLGLTQTEVAALCGVHERTWRRWETEGAGPVASRLIDKLLDEEN